MRRWMFLDWPSVPLMFPKSPSRQARLGFSAEISWLATSANREPFWDSDTRLNR